MLICDSDDCYDSSPYLTDQSGSMLDVRNVEGTTRGELSISPERQSTLYQFFFIKYPITHQQL